MNNEVLYTASMSHGSERGFVYRGLWHSAIIEYLRFCSKARGSMKQDTFDWLLKPELVNLVFLRLVYTMSSEVVFVLIRWCERVGKSSWNVLQSLENAYSSVCTVLAVALLRRIKLSDINYINEGMFAFGSTLAACLTVIVFGAALVGLSGAIYCQPCNPLTCPHDLHCPGGSTTDPCGCCRVCARLINETCGGSFELLGRCAAGLQCFITPPAYGAEVTGQEEGTCQGKLM